MGNNQTVIEKPRTQTQIEKLAERQTPGSPYDRYHSGQATETDVVALAKTFAARFKSDYYEFRTDPTLMYRVGLEMINDARPLIESYLKQLNKKA
ncbi:MAG: hypothetical protein WC364_14055 [Eubacteriales bacterium]|jgi:hypothetical protein